MKCSRWFKSLSTDEPIRSSAETHKNTHSDPPTVRHQLKIACEMFFRFSYCYCCCCRRRCCCCYWCRSGAAYRVNALPLNIYSVPYGNVIQTHWLFQFNSNGADSFFIFPRSRTISFYPSFSDARTPHINCTLLIMHCVRDFDIFSSRFIRVRFLLLVPYARIRIRKRKSSCTLYTQALLEWLNKIESFSPLWEPLNVTWSKAKSSGNAFFSPVRHRRNYCSNSDLFKHK